MQSRYREEHTDLKQTHAVVATFITVSFMNLSTPIEFNEVEKLGTWRVIELFGCVQIQLMHISIMSVQEVFSPNIRFKTTNRTQPGLCLKRHLKYIKEIN